MANKTPLRGAYNGASLTGLAEFTATDTIGVADGGTGAASLTNNGLLIGNGTGVVQTTGALSTNGQIVIGGTSGPALANLTGTANEVEITDGDGTIQIGLPSTVQGLTTVSATNLGGTLTTAAQTSVTSLGTLTSLDITGDLVVDTTTLVADSSENRVGIGTALPSHTLDVEGVANASTCVVAPDLCATTKVVGAAICVGGAFALPTAAGTAGDIVCTDGSGGWVYSTDAQTSPGGANTQLQFNNSGSFGGSADLTWDGSVLKTASVCATGNTVIGGDLTIAGDDITMATNTSGALLVADGTNFNPVVLSGDATIASNGALTIADNAVDNDMLAGSIANTKLANSSVSVTDGSTASDVSLGGTLTFSGTNNEVEVAQSGGTVTIGLPATIQTTGVTTSGDVTVGGDLTISGDDLTMGTNTSGHILVADGTNYNPVAVSGDVTIDSTGAITIGAGSVTNSMLDSSTMSVGGVTLTLGATDATPAFDLSDATAYTGDSALVTVGTITSGTWQGTAVASNKIAGTLDAKTFTGTTTLNGALAGSNFLDEDDMSSDSATSVASQQSIKAYVDSVASGLDMKESSHVATTANLAATYDNGTDGVGATLTNSGSQAALEIDGQTTVATERVLVKNQATTAQNGIYVVTTVGDGSTNWVLTRATDFDTSSEVDSGSFTFVETGTVNADHGFVMTTDGAITFGTTAINWSQFSGAGQITAGAGLTKSGSTLNVVAGSNITVNADDVALSSTVTGLTALTATTLTGTLATAAQGNVTSVGGLTSLCVTGNTVIGGDVTIAGDDLTMGTNTSGYLLIADGTNYNPTAVTGDVTINGSGATTIGNTKVTNAMLAGSIANAKLTNSSINVTDGSNDTDISLGGTLTFSGTNNEVEVAESGGTVTVGLPSTVSGLTTVSAGTITGTSGVGGTLTTAAQTNITSVGTLSGLTVGGDASVTGDLTIADDGLKLATTNTAGHVLVNDGTNFNPVAFSGDVTIASNGAVTIAAGSVENSMLAGGITNANLAGSISQDKLAGGITNGKLANSTITVSDGSTTTAVALGGTVTYSGTSNEVEVSESSGTITVGLPATVSGLTEVSAGTITGTNVAGTLTTAAQAAITSVGTLTSLGVSGDLTVDTNSLKVDSTNNRVGIGTATPSHTLDVEGNANVTGNVIGGALCVAGAFDLPTAAGTAGQIICTDGGGNWVYATDATTSAAGNDTEIQFNNSGDFGASSNLTFASNVLAAPTVTATTLNGTLGTAAQANVTSVGNLTSLCVAGGLTVGGATSIIDTVTVGVNDAGHDVTLFGDTSGCKWFWDTSTDDMIVTGGSILCGDVAVGVDATGHDVTFYGDTTGCKWMWDQSADKMIVTGTAEVTGDYTVGGDLTVSGGNITLDDNTSGKILVADGTNYGAVAISGDATLSSAGALTIGAGVVENSMLAGGITNANLANSTISVTDGTTSSDVSLGSTITFADTTNETEITQSGGTVTVGLPSTVSGLTTISATNLGGTLTTAAQTAITSVGSLTSLAVAGATVLSGNLTIGDSALRLATTNTSGHVLINDGTNFNPKALTGDVTIDSNGAVTIGAGVVENSMLANSTVSYGGVSLSLGGSDATPAFNLSDATAYPGDSSLVTVGTIASGTWQGTAVASAYIASTLNAKTFSGTTTLNGALAGSSFLDEDDMSSNSATAVASQQSIKAYVDSVASGLDVKGSVHVATTANIGATYDNGTSGVGATLTNSGSQAAIEIDGQTLTSAERVLVKDQSTAAQNGIYSVTTVGDGSTNWVLTRTTDFDTSTEANSGAFTFVETGSSNADSGWVMTTDGDITFGTTAIDWSQFSGAGSISAGAGLTKSGNVLNVGAGDNITVNGDDVALSTTVTGLTALTATTLTGTLGTAAQANVTSVGTLTGLAVGGNASVTGDLTIADDGLKLSTTNTAGHVLINDGTNFNPKALSGDVTIDSNGATTIGATSVDNSMLAGSIANSKLSNSSITVTDGSNSTDMALGSTLTISGTSNEVEVAESSGTVTVGLPSTVSGLTGISATTLTGTLQPAAQANVTSVGTLSSLAVSGDLTVDTTSLKVDSSNNRVGIGTATPSHTLDVEGVAHALTCVVTPDVCATTKVVAAALCVGGAYALPAADGTAGEVLCTDGSGGISFVEAQAGHTISEAGSALADRTCLNFVGTNIVATDNSGTNATDITVSSTTPVLPFTKEDGTADNLNLSTTTIGGSLVCDTTPQLGGDLDVNGHSIVSASNGNIAIAPNGSGVVAVTGAQTISGDFTVDTTTLHVKSSNNRVGIGTVAPSHTLDVEGDINASGTVYGATKDFLIDHPMADDEKPNKYNFMKLAHSALEGPEYGVYYRGTAELSDGRVTVELPEYFNSLVDTDDATIQLTNVDGFSPLSVELQDGEKFSNNSFVVRTNDSGDSNQKFDWQVNARRIDKAIMGKTTGDKIRANSAGRLITERWQYRGEISDTNNLNNLTSDQLDELIEFSNSWDTTDENWITPYNKNSVRKGDKVEMINNALQSA